MLKYYYDNNITNTENNQAIFYFCAKRAFAEIKCLRKRYFSNNHKMNKNFLKNISLTVKKQDVILALIN